MTMKLFNVAFIGNRANETQVQARTMKQAKELFAAINHVNGTDYIVARKAA
jgi:hypothetical protein